jgi:hypothetical protein
MAMSCNDVENCVGLLVNITSMNTPIAVFPPPGVGTQYYPSSEYVAHYPAIEVPPSRVIRVMKNVSAVASSAEPENVFDVSMSCSIIKALDDSKLTIGSFVCSTKSSSASCFGIEGTRVNAAAAVASYASSTRPTILFQLGVRPSRGCLDCMHYHQYYGKNVEPKKPVQHFVFHHTKFPNRRQDIKSAAFGQYSMRRIADNFKDLTSIATKAREVLLAENEDRRKAIFGPMKHIIVLIDGTPLETGDGEDKHVVSIPPYDSVMWFKFFSHFLQSHRGESSVMLILEQTAMSSAKDQIRGFVQGAHAFFTSGTLSPIRRTIAMEGSVDEEAEFDEKAVLKAEMTATKLAETLEAIRRETSGKYADVVLLAARESDQFVCPLQPDALNEGIDAIARQSDEQLANVYDSLRNQVDVEKWRILRSGAVKAPGSKGLFQSHRQALSRLQDVDTEVCQGAKKARTILRLLHRHIIKVSDLPCSMLPGHEGERHAKTFNVTRALIRLGLARAALLPNDTAVIDHLLISLDWKDSAVERPRYTKNFVLAFIARKLFGDEYVNEVGHQLVREPRRFLDQLLRDHYITEYDFGKMQTIRGLLSTKDKFDINLETLAERVLASPSATIEASAINKANKLKKKKRKARIQKDEDEEKIMHFFDGDDAETCCATLRNINKIFTSISLAELITVMTDEQASNLVRCIPGAFFSKYGWITGSVGRCSGSTTKDVIEFAKDVLREGHLSRHKTMLLEMAQKSLSIALTDNLVWLENVKKIMGCMEGETTKIDEFEHAIRHHSKQNLIHNLRTAARGFTARQVINALFIAEGLALVEQHMEIPAGPATEDWIKKNLAPFMLAHCDQVQYPPWAKTYTKDWTLKGKGKFECSQLDACRRCAKK